MPPAPIPEHVHNHRLVSHLKTHQNIIAESLMLIPFLYTVHIFWTVLPMMTGGAPASMIRSVTYQMYLTQIGLVMVPIGIGIGYKLYQMTADAENTPLAMMKVVDRVIDLVASHIILTVYTEFRLITMGLFGAGLVFSVYIGSPLLSIMYLYIFISNMRKYRKQLLNRQPRFCSEV